MRFGVGGGGRIARGGASVGRGGVRGGVGIGPFSVSGGSGGGGGGLFELVLWLAVVIFGLLISAVLLAFSFGPVLYGFVPDSATRAARNAATAALFVLGGLLCYEWLSMPRSSDAFWDVVGYCVLLALGVGAMAARPVLALYLGGWSAVRSFGVRMLSNRAFQTCWVLLTVSALLLAVLAIATVEVTGSTEALPRWLNFADFPPILTIPIGVIITLAPLTAYLLVAKRTRLLEKVDPEWTTDKFWADRYLQSPEGLAARDRYQEKQRKRSKDSPSRRFFDRRSSQLSKAWGGCDSARTSRGNPSCSDGCD